MYSYVEKNTFVVKVNISIQFVTNLTKGETALILKTIRRMLNLGYVFLRYILIYNLEVSFNFSCNIFTIKVFSLLPAIYFELPITRTPDNTNFFRFAWRFELSGVVCL